MVVVSEKERVEVNVLRAVVVKAPVTVLVTVTVLTTTGVVVAVAVLTPVMVVLAVVVATTTDVAETGVASKLHAELRIIELNVAKADGVLSVDEVACRLTFMPGPEYTTPTS